MPKINTYGNSLKNKLKIETKIYTGDFQSLTILKLFKKLYKKKTIKIGQILPSLDLNKVKVLNQIRTKPILYSTE